MKQVIFGLFMIVSCLTKAGPAVSGGNLGFAPSEAASIQIDQVKFRNFKNDIQQCLNGKSLEAQAGLQLSNAKTKEICRMHGFAITEQLAPSYRVEKLQKNFPSVPGHEDIQVKSQDRYLCVAYSGLRCWSK